MIETSKDVLFLILALCVAFITFFSCWGLYYIVMMLKRGHQVIKEVSDLIAYTREKMEKVERLIDTLEEKINNSASYLPLLFKGITELVGFFKKKSEKGKQKKSA
jgi:hypothetical protein